MFDLQERIDGPKINVSQQVVVDIIVLNVICMECVKSRTSINFL